MSIFDRIREYLRRHNDLNAGRDPVWDDGAGYAPTETMPAAPAYEPHGIDTPETLAGIVAKAQADAGTAQASAETEQWGTWDEPGTPPELVPSAPEPRRTPPMPYSGVSSSWVASITPPDPADISYDTPRKYRAYLREIGAATGTSTSLEDTGMWALSALEPGDGTGVRL